MRLIVSIVGGPSARPFLQMCLESLEMQDRQPDEVLITLDGGAAWAGYRWRGSWGYSVIVNEQPRYVLANTLANVERSGAGPEDVIITLDADDWLCRRDALALVEKAHSSGAWVTYGSWISNSARADYPSRLPPYPLGSSPRKAAWLGTQLRTWRRGLLDRIRREDLEDEDGELLRCCPDLAVMIPAMELAGLDRCRHIAEPIYHYNRDSGACVADTRRREQVRAEALIRSREPYKRLASLT